MIPRLHVPVLEPEDVVRHLGKQEMHWKEGRSAHALATAWFGANAFPPRVAAVLGSHPDFASAELIDAFVERQVDLGSEGRPSQTDLLAVAGIGNDLAILAVEAKAGEGFGDPTGQWLDGSAGKRARLDGLCPMLGLTREAALPLRYQLLHRSASALIEARRYRASRAALLVHSFSGDEPGFADFAAFVAAVGFDGARPDTLLGPVDLEGTKLYAGWVQDRPAVAGTYLDSLRDYARRLERWCERVRGWCDEQSSKLKPPAE